ncbi:3-hydroxy-3-methylglutaryl-coenzyme A reductase-like isoform X2 [Anneissia japonica]|uniref:3-hydroxy-3-methylglutaryl-coenzyme A reductase-like isoform X2 n=1 Tax=Anneissia japonica TaxID=1529436 RepID=UPI00142597D9|nr:3-hydroxy-3-methylglutaryl-coenzyme A reductase-like isoform X2 [Anneissia japonica]
MIICLKELTMDVIGYCGLLCASHPFEVIISTLTLAIYLLSANLGLKILPHCGSASNYCTEAKDEAVFGDILMTFARSLAVCYIYFQFRNLKKKHSKYVIGIAAIFTILCMLIFGTVAVHVFHKDIIAVNDVLPVFLLMMDLSKSSKLTSYAIAAESEVKLAENIAHGLRIMAPSVTLDAVVMALAFALGSQSGVHQLELMCLFACVAIITNYIVFMTVFPACLSLVLELCNHGVPGHPVWKQGKPLELVDEQETRTANPVLQKVKLVMSFGLAVVHAHRFTSPSVVNERNNQTLFDSSGEEARQHRLPTWQTYVMRAVSMNVEQVFTSVLALVLMAKFFFIDTADTKKRIRFTSEQSNSDMYDGIDLPSMMYKSKEVTDVETQTASNTKPKRIFHIGSIASESSSDSERETEEDEPTSIPKEPRPLQECLQILNNLDNGPDQLSNEEVKQLVLAKHIPSYKMEDVLQDYERGVQIRRDIVTDKLCDQESLKDLPFKGYQYNLVHGACCENVIGYMPLPVGTAGPLTVDGKQYMVPMATTEGTLVASTNRGCRALQESGGVITAVYKDGMTRAPVLQLPSIQDVSKVKQWLDNDDNFQLLKQTFDSTSSFAKLTSVQPSIAGRNLYLRFLASTGDAMGMNMVSKGTEKSLKLLQEIFPQLEVLSLSGNVCTDKKPAAINWIEGRGKSVTCEAIIPGNVVKKVLKTSTSALVNLNTKKNLIGSAVAGTLGGCNAHAANIVTAVFVATGQDIAQNIASSNCLTTMESTGENGEDLYMSCTMPSVEVGTIGGGTILPAQQSCLQMLGVKGPCIQEPGRNASNLARIVCAAVLAGELSLMSALAAGHLVKSHMKHNRSSQNIAEGDDIGNSASDTDKRKTQESAVKDKQETEEHLRYRGHPR